jgi:hypothetical protein
VPFLRFDIRILWLTFVKGVIDPRQQFGCIDPLEQAAEHFQVRHFIRKFVFACEKTLLKDTFRSKMKSMSMQLLPRRVL